MTITHFCVKVQNRRKKAGLKTRKAGLGEEKMMFTISRRSYLNLESHKRAQLDHEERSTDFACADKIRLIREAVIRE